MRFSQLRTFAVLILAFPLALGAQEKNRFPSLQDALRAGGLRLDEPGCLCR